MAYNSRYQTRNSGRFNTPGQFVSGGELQTPPPAPQRIGSTRIAPPPPPPPSQPPHQQQQSMFPQGVHAPNLQMIQTTDVEMKPETPMDDSEAGDTTNGGTRPHWMKTKLAGVKKVSNKERRRRQNETLRKLLTPKNALMVLNEMMPNEHLTNQMRCNSITAQQFKVEAASQYNMSQYYNKPGQHSFCADLTIDGNTYKGYGENKLTARNAAAEQAIRDLMIKKMSRVLEVAGGAEGGEGGAAGGAGGAAGGGESAEGADENPEEALPMIQLASFALHKLFSEWEYEGHKVPQLKSGSQADSPPRAGVPPQGCEPAGAGAGEAAPPPPPPPPPKPKAPKKARELPLNAAAMHPCMLLTYMRPHLEYRELAVEGERPQNMIFTMGVDVDSATYIGKASNKKEARKAAARAACSALFGVRFDDVATANAPLPPA